MKLHLPPIPSNKNPTTPKTNISASPKWSFTLNPYSTLDRSIRTNGASQYLGDAIVRPSQELHADDIMNEARGEIINNLNTVRKRLDEVKEAAEKKSRDSDKLKRDLEKIKVDEESLSGGLNNTHGKLEQLKVALQVQKTKIEEISYDKETYELMLDRIKKDKTTDQIKINHLEAEYNKQYHWLIQKIQEINRGTEFYTKTKKFVSEVEKQVVDEKHKRQDNLHLLEFSLTTREEYETEKEKRNEHIQNVAEDAANEVGFDQKQYTELLLTHKFLKFFLKSKIDKQTQRFEAVEKAYQKIKAATGLNDLSEITSRFLHREEKYSELLISIADSERKVNEARKINEHIDTKVKELREESNMLDKLREERRDGNGQTAEVQRELNLKMNAQKKAHLILDSAHKWSVKTLTKINKAQNVSVEEYSENQSEEKMAEVFLKLIDQVKLNLAALQEKDGDSPRNAITVDVAMMNKDFVSKNVRVKPKNSKFEDENQRVNGSGSYSDHEEDLGKEVDEEVQNTTTVDRQRRGN